LYEKCINTLHKMHETTVKVNIEKGKYATSGGHDVYDQDMRVLYDEYNNELKNIDIAEVLFRLNFRSLKMVQHDIIVVFVCTLSFTSSYVVLVFVTYMYYYLNHTYDMVLTF
jgi:hypothetical protein